MLLNQSFKKTIIMVTHDPMAAGYANRILRLNKGGLLFEDPKDPKDFTLRRGSPAGPSS